MTDLELRYIQLVDKVNYSRTRNDHYQWHERLCGFLEGVTACGGNAGHLIMHGDDVQRSRGVDREMCGGCWLDWEPQTDIDTTKGGSLLDGLIRAWVPEPDGTMAEVTPHRKSAEQESTDTSELTPHDIEVIHRTVCQPIRAEMNESSPVHCIPTRYLHMLLDAVDTAVSMMQDAQRWRSVMRNPAIQQHLDNAIRQHLDDILQQQLDEAANTTKGGA